MKRRSRQIVGCLLAVAAIVGLLQFKFAIESKEEQLADLNRQYVEDERAIRVLRAEWAYLNSPQALQALTQRHLGLRPLTADKILVNSKAVPIRTAPADMRNLTPLTPTSDLRPREKPAWAYTLGSAGTASSAPTPGHYSRAAAHRQR